jgi:hypothetical protein
MRQRPATPEDLDALLEDATVLKDERSVSELFDRDAIIVGPDGHEVRGRLEIAGIVAGWEHAYVAEPRQVVQVRSTALVVGTSAIQVARRSRDRSWRVEIMLFRREEGGRNVWARPWSERASRA